MASFLIAIIYLAFISLGLPDSLLGSGWPVMHAELGVPLSYAGAVSFLIAGGAVASSLLSARITRRFGAGVVTIASVGLTAAAMFGFSVSNQFWMLCALALPYGLGAGGVDAALNNYVAVHYSSRHMNWLHCFWGIGASISPYIMSWCLTSGRGWNGGYRTVSLLQVGLTLLLFLSLPLWKRNAPSAKSASAPAVGLSSMLKIPGVKCVLAAFFCYCSLESTTGLWASSYLVADRAIAPEIAARYASLFFIGITGGRFLSGFISDKAGDKNMIRIGIGVLICGILCVLIPFGVKEICLYGLVIAGLGCAPIFPSIIHATPANFGADKSQLIVGVQMASAYTGSTLMPPLFGKLADVAGMWIYPVFLLIFALVMLLMSERLNSVVKRVRK